MHIIPWTNLTTIIQKKKSEEYHGIFNLKITLQSKFISVHYYIKGWIDVIQQGIRIQHNLKLIKSNEQN